MLLNDCPVRSTLLVIGGKWKPMILRELKTGVLRFGQLRRKIPEASHKVLIEQLQQLQMAGIVERTLHKESVLRSEYYLSPYGRTLRPVLEELAAWGKMHRNGQRSKIERATVKRAEAATHAK